MKESGQKFKYSTCEVSPVTGVQFSIMGEEEINRWTVTELHNIREEDEQQQSRDLTGDGELCDPRLGINAPSDKCKLCGQNRECPGHFGHIKLQKPIYHIGYMDTVIKILKCICPHCSKLKTLPINHASLKEYNQLVDYAVGKEYVKRKRQLRRRAQGLDHDEEDRITTEDCMKERKKNPKKDQEQQGRLRVNLRKLSKILEKITSCLKNVETEENQDQENQNKDDEFDIERECRNQNLPNKISKFKYHQIRAVTKQGSGDKQVDEEVEYSAEKVYEMFKKISDVDCVILGFGGTTKPKDLLISSLLVPPPQVRPTISFAPNKPASHDDLTRVYQNVLKDNAHLKQLTETNGTQEEINKILHSMTLNIGRMMDNEKNALKDLQLGKKKKKVKSIKSRLKGKEGRFRQNLMGKRVDFSARSVISGDANLHLDQLGVPRALAYELTVPIVVTQHNRNFVLNLVRCDYIKTVLQLNKNSSQEEYTAFTDMDTSAMEKMINYGTIVERFLMDDDYVIFNRQPTLHKMSMMGHRVKILTGSTFRLNLSVTTPYNADFDGDEMNMHVPQSTESQSELKNLAHVPKQIVAPKSNKPVMGIVQDSLLGSCLFTLRDTFLTKPQVMGLAMFILDWNGQLPMPAILRPQPLWTGKQIMSMIIPHKIQLIKPGQDSKDVWCSTDDSTIYIEKGELLQGIMNKSIIGDGAGGLIHTVWLDESDMMCCNFMTQAQRIVNNWLIMAGFTISCSDMVPLLKCDQEVQRIMDESEVKWAESLKKFEDPQQVETEKLHKPGTSIFVSFEFEVNQSLNDYRNKANKAATKEIPFRYNNFKRMVWSGSKGKDQNLAQVLGVVGQQNVEGRRIDMGFSRRTLPHFQKDTHGLSERGYVKKNFFRGLQVYEFFFHTMGGREGLSDTAVKTARTGYIQRKLVKAIEDVKVCYDGTVRDAHGTIIETSYGEDGLAGEFIEFHDYYSKKIIPMGDQEFKKTYNFMSLSKEQRELLDSKILEELPDEEEDESCQLYQEFLDLIQHRDLMRKCFVKHTRIANVYLPVDIRRIIRDVRMGSQVTSQRNKKSNLSPFIVITKVQELFGRIEEMFAKKGAENNILLFKAHVAFNLNSKKLIFEDKINQDNLDSIVGEIERKFYKSMSHAGECIGSIAAQSIGEPTTQMTLNTFHFAGSSDRNVTLGVPRLQELLDASRNIKTPSVSIYFHPRYNMLYVGKKKTDEVEPGSADRTDLIQEFQDKLVPAKIVDYISKTEIYYDPDPKNSILAAEENEFSLAEYEFEPWILVVYLKATHKTSKIIKKLRETISDGYDITEEDDAVNNRRVLKIRIMKGQAGQGMINQEDADNDDDDDKESIDGEEKSAYQQLEKLEYKIINNMKLVVGITGITKVMHGSNEYDYLHLLKGETLEKGQIYKEKFLLTEGTNLTDIYQLDEIDTTRTISNDVMEITRVLGIEAARITMISEMTAVFGKYEIYVNQRHLNILIDWMTHRGGVIPCTRNGINRIPTVSALRKSSFEETVEMLYDASVYSELDGLKGVSENLVFGQKCYIGTNTFSLQIDYNKVKDTIIVPNKMVDQDKFEQDEQYVDDSREFQADQDENHQYNQTPVYINTPGPMMATPNIMNTPGAYDAAFTPSHALNMSVRGPDKAFSPMYIQQGGNSSHHQFNASPSYTVHSPAYQPPQSNQYSPNAQNSNSVSPGMSQSNSPNYSPNSPTQQSPQNYQQSPSSPAYQASINSPSSNYTNSQQNYSSRQQVYSPSSPNYKSPQSPGVGGGSASPQQSYSPQSQSPSYQNQNSSYQQNSSPVYRHSSTYQQSPGNGNASQQLSVSNNPGQSQSPEEEFNKQKAEAEKENYEEEEEEDDEED